MQFILIPRKSETFTRDVSGLISTTSYEVECRLHLQD